MNWKKQPALQKLEIEQVTFDPQKNDEPVHGYAMNGTRKFAVNPFTPYKAAAGFHEMGHIVLGHTKTALKNMKEQYLDEMEACAVAIICLRKLGVVNGLDPQRQHYMRHRVVWHQKVGDLPADFKQRVNEAAEKILAAGTVEEEFQEAA